ncbi:flavin monoamine oxidase family protein [Aeromicrobium sp. JJY06]|uniref:flavin monoamine oxidase family protein n=1 Tax=Aeromicrobium sp. JJY06 TaxID=3373478 RepID=UPI00376EE075
MTTAIVIGGGSAGMSAARRLSQSGVGVTVVEARPRLGGRTWSETMVDGTIVERGGEYFSSTQLEVHALVEELGLSWVSQGFSPDVRPTIHPDDPSLDELEKGADQIADHWASLGDVHESVSIKQVIDAAPVDARVAEIVAARLSSGMAASVARVSAKWVSGGSDRPRVNHEISKRIREGNQSLSERMAEELGYEHILRRWPVASVTHEGQRYVVTNVRGEQLKADLVVVAVPASIASRIEIEGLDPRTTRAIDRIGFGQATKLHLVVLDGGRPGMLQEVSTPFSTWATAGVDSDQAAFVTGFGSTHETQTKLAVEHGPSVFRPQLEAQWPGYRFGDYALLTYWGGDPWARGAYSYRPLGWTEEDQEYLARPSGRIFFAGEHTAGENASGINGAIRSGYRAAQEALASL